MIELQGKYSSAKVFTDNIENEAISQIINLMNQPFSEGSVIRIMPDVHAGAGCTIGTTMTITDKICPNLVGVDIGCGMMVVKLKDREIDLAKLDEVIHERIPAGHKTRKQVHKKADHFILGELENLHVWKRVNQVRAVLSIGSLGGGNHFIELNRDYDDNLYLVIHSGSRHLGLEVAKYYQKVAYNQINNAVNTLNDRAGEVNTLIEQLKAEGRHSEIEQAVRDMRGKYKTSVPKDLAFATGALRAEYLHDMVIAQKYAFLSRAIMAEEIISAMGLTKVEQFQTIHNYIDTDSMILRKGAVSARAGEKLLIPINMRDGSLLCYGKGNADWNYSAPHGAGRLMSRSAAKATLSMDDYKETMGGIYSSTVNQSTLDEAPAAYKPMEEIITNIQETVEVAAVLSPIYNFKSSE